MRFLTSTLLAAALAALVPSIAAAQTQDPEPATAFSDLALRLPPQSFVIITDQQGRQTRGQFGAIAGEAITIRAMERTLTFAQADVRQVQKKLPDSVLDGGFIGLAIGFVGPFAVCATRSDSSETVGCAIGSLGFGGLPGFAIGALVDRVRWKTVTLFRSNSATTPSQPQRRQ